MPQKTIVITSGTTWVVPFDWNSSNNRIEAIGGGGGGWHLTGGGGGGAYSRINNFTATPGQTIAITIGAGGAVNTDGGTTQFANASTLTAVGGSRATSSGARAPGGSAASSVGTIKFSGGNGGVQRGGGGGAGGPAGNGANGFNGTMTVQAHANGGRAANNAGGGGGVAVSSQGRSSQVAGAGLDLSSNVVGFSISSQTFRYVRWSVTALRSPGSDMQASEFILINSNTVLNMAGSTITSSRAASSTEQGANNLIDGNLNSKYYTGVTTSPWNFTIDLGSAKTFNGYAWATAEDVSNRDPVSWTLDVSSDNVNWTTVSTVTNYSTTTTRKEYVPSTITIVGSGGGGAGSYYSDV